MPQRRRVAAAIVLHGKLGRFDRGVEGEPTRAVHAGVVGALDLAVFCYAGYVRHVLEPSRSAGLDVHFFGHSWSPTIGKALDALFRPRASSHEPEEVKRNHRLCRELEVSLLRVGNGFQGFFTGMDGWGQNSCERTASHLLGISRAVELMRRSERASELEYERVLISRWDTLWQRPLPLTSLPIAPGVFVLPHQCASSGPPDTSALVQHRHRVCGGGGDHWLGAIASGSQITTGAIECGPPSRGCENDLTKSARAVFVLDWWIAARRLKVPGAAPDAEVSAEAMEEATRGASSSPAPNGASSSPDPDGPIASTSRPQGVVSSTIRVGYCATTDNGPSDCINGHKGSVPRLPDLQACVGFCQQCARCRFISYSTSHADCSWFSHCRAFERGPVLGLDFGGATYVSMQVKEHFNASSPKRHG